MSNPYTKRVRRRGYLPFGLVTNRTNQRGEVLVEFEDRSRKWMDASKVDRA